MPLESEWEMKRIALKPLSERRNFFLGSYLGILKDLSITMRSLPFYSIPASFWSRGEVLLTLVLRQYPSWKPLRRIHTSSFVSVIHRSLFQLLGVLCYSRSITA